MVALTVFELRRVSLLPQVPEVTGVESHSCWGRNVKVISSFGTELMVGIKDTLVEEGTAAKVVPTASIQDADFCRSLRIVKQIVPCAYLRSAIDG
jgi:hypothetical protein